MSHPATYRPEQVHESAFIAKGAVVLGDVTLEESASFWFNAVARGDCAPIKVGARSNIQDGCVLHADPGFPCTIGEGVTVGHGAIVHGATVGNNAIIGMKSVIQNGAVIGDDCIVGVGAVVTERAEIPPRSLVLGIPAKVKRPLSDEEVAAIALSAEHYVENAKQFKAAGQTAALD